ncbi:SRPBCC family protein [Actinoplanes couchii]|uniref:Polyketide cyclase/dehydrase n=1 Tax=Actinoplanes couchii TaxID=403638 RepID=A0ABQ3XL57_9ACTN|nr:SRPBCC family protein [Actinoplanes couchii]MDR6318401.1 hypothetical protein [Actinoplanes couchii]GID59233.1 hypothetical protein Aco03nite_076370 [Actinoplanes couchii]
MKYTVSLEIGVPRDRVVQLLSEPEHLPYWLRGLVSHEPVNGVHGQVGTESRVVLRMGQQQFEATETITRLERDAPDGIVRYDRELTGAGMWNAARERLIETGPATTLWESENEYRFDSLPMRLGGFLMTGAFRKQSLQHMRDFQAFAENGTDVRTTDQ